MLGGQYQGNSPISVGSVGAIKDIAQHWSDVDIGISGNGSVAVIVKGARCQTNHLAESANGVKML